MDLRGSNQNSRLGVEMSFGGLSLPVSIAEKSQKIVLQKLAEGSRQAEDAHLVDQDLSFAINNHDPHNPDIQPTKTEKLLVVLLVAVGTVCILTNLLILGILFRQKGRLCLRYQLVLSQACVGILSSSVIIYPLKLASLILLDPAHSRTRLSSSDTLFFTSKWVCLAFGSAPLVASILLGLLHSLTLYLEQVLAKISINSYKQLISSPNLIKWSLFMIWILPIIIVLLLPLIQLNPWDNVSKNNYFCYLPGLWNGLYSTIIWAFMAILILIVLSLFIMESIKSKKKISTERQNMIKGGKKRRKSNPKIKDNLRHQEETKKTSLVVIQSCNLVSEAISNSSFLTQSGLYEQNKTCLLNFALSCLLSIPALIHCTRFTNSEQPLTRLDLLHLAEEDQVLMWSWLLVILASSLTPVLILLTDEVISSLGVNMVRSFENWLSSLNPQAWFGKSKPVARMGMQNPSVHA